MALVPLYPLRAPIAPIGPYLEGEEQAPPRQRGQQVGQQRDAIGGDPHAALGGTYSTREGGTDPPQGPYSAHRGHSPPLQAPP